MDLVFKKYFWVVNLGALSLLAFMVASTVNQWVGSQMSAVPRLAAGSDTTTAGGAPRMGRLALTQPPGDQLRDWLIFDLEPKVDEGDEPEQPENTDKEAEVTKPEGELEESELPIDLEGTAPVTTAEGMSTAVIKVEGETKIAFVGSEFLDGKAKIADIQPRFIVVQEGGTFKVIKLWSEKAKSAPPGRRGFGKKDKFGPRGASKSKRPAPRPKPARGRSNAAKGVKKTGAYSYEIDRKMLDTQLADLSKLTSQARIVPNYRGGKYQGFKLVGVRPGSLYRSIGIRSGDVIKSINGRPIDSPNKAIELFEKLKNSTSIELDFERRGQPKTLNYSIK